MFSCVFFSYSHAIMQHTCFFCMCMKYEEKAGEKWEIYICCTIIFTMYIPAAKSCATISSGILDVCLYMQNPTAASTYTALLYL